MLSASAISELKILNVPANIKLLIGFNFYSGNFLRLTFVVYIGIYIILHLPQAWSVNVVKDASFWHFMFNNYRWKSTLCMEIEGSKNWRTSQRRKYWPGLASCKVAWCTEHINRHKLKWSLHCITQPFDLRDILFRAMCFFNMLWHLEIRSR